MNDTSASNVIKQAILAYLRSGDATALEVRQFFHLSHEQVYMALVQLEAEGRVRVWARSPDKENVWCAEVELAA